MSYPICIKSLLSMPDYHQRVSYSIVEWLPIYIWNMFCMDDIWFGLRSGQLIMCMFWRWIRVEWSIKTIFILCYSNNNYDNYYLGSGNSFKYLWMIVSVNRLPLRYMICPFNRCPEFVFYGIWAYVVWITVFHLTE